MTSIALSADHSAISGGHTNGSIFTWDITKPAKPVLQIPSTDLSRLRSAENDGHVSGSAVLHVGFLGTRHTALVSADGTGMAFAHHAAQGMGILARSIRSTRVLGRYPEPKVASSRPKKPSSVLALSALPLGNVEQASDSMDLVAMLTPYLLVIVSTTPIAQTQYKAARPKELEAHSAMSGCLAWFPAVKLKNLELNSLKTSSKTKLAYCWSNILTILEVAGSEPNEANGNDKPQELRFKPRKRWQAEESIVAIQWLSRSVLGLLTISQQLIILEDVSLKVTESSDLIQKHVYHADLFSQQLNLLVEQLDEEDSSMHGVVADAFYMSFRAYKGRLFLLGYNDIYMGTLSNWADRLLALMECGDFIGAIQLATVYYNGDAEKATIGLPEDDRSRHALVQEKLLEMMAASLKYAFGKNRNARTPQLQHNQLRELASACFTACLCVGDRDFLFDAVYSWYEEANAQGVFLETMEPYINDGEINILPPTVVKDLVNHFMEKGFQARLEDVICRLDPQTIDIDQLTTLCKENNLFDALLYIWNQGLGDYITILSDIIESQSMQGSGQANVDMRSDLNDSTGTSKLFPYLSYILTGRVYPTGKEMSEDKATVAKAEIFNFFFSGGDGQGMNDRKKIATNGRSIVPFTNLRKILNLDAPSFLSMLNEAFEDDFLTGSTERTEDFQNVTEEQRFGLSINRQYVVSILLEVMTSSAYAPEDMIYLDMFLSRNLAKYPQFVLLPGATLDRILLDLCNYPIENDGVTEDCQLSVEYLLSIYQPPDISSLMPLFSRAKFFRVLKSIYKSEKQYSELLQTCFEDTSSPDAVFQCIADCLGHKSGLSEKQIDEVKAVIARHAQVLCTFDVSRAASTLEQYASDLHEVALDALKNDDHSRFRYLRQILDPSESGKAISDRASSNSGLIELYVQLLCDYDPHHVTEYVEHLKSGDIRLEEVLPALESSGAVDAAVVLLAREGKVRHGIDRLIQHLKTLESPLLGLLERAKDSPDTANTQEACDDLTESLSKYARVGIWLCRGQTKAAANPNALNQQLRRSRSFKGELSVDETLWLDLLDAVVQITKNVTEAVESQRNGKEGRKSDDRTSSQKIKAVNNSKHVLSLRTLVQDTFTALLTTTSDSPIKDAHQTNVSFLRILRAFLERVSLSSPSLSSLRTVLATIFSAYSYEESLLTLANQLLDDDLFVHVAKATALRKRGWRSLGQVCEGCGKRVWGPGAGGDIWYAWERTQQTEALQRDANEETRPSGTAVTNNGKGKGVTDEDSKPVQSSGSVPSGVARSKASRSENNANAKERCERIVLFSCRHMFHEQCLDEIQAAGKESTQMEDLDEQGRRRFSCPLCT